jgi:hypothetical protein
MPSSTPPKVSRKTIAPIAAGPMSFLRDFERARAKTT